MKHMRLHLIKIITNYQDHEQSDSDDYDSFEENATSSEGSIEQTDHDCCRVVVAGKFARSRNSSTCNLEKIVEDPEELAEVSGRHLTPPRLRNFVPQYNLVRLRIQKNAQDLALALSKHTI